MLRLNVKIVVQCSECMKWRVCYTERVFNGEKSNNWSRNLKACPSRVARIFKILKIIAASTMLSVIDVNMSVANRATILCRF